MSVHLTLTKTSDGIEISVPISTESFFLKAWRPLAIRKSLYYIEALQSGYDINQEYLANLVRELKIVKDSINEIDFLASDELSFFEERINFIINEIQGQVPYADVEGWVG